MNGIDRLIGFMSEAFIHANSTRFKIIQDESGYAQILDNNNRILIKIGVKEIVVTKYDMETGNLLHKIVIDWDILTFNQKQQIINMLEINEELDPEIENTINQILDGV